MIFLVSRARARVRLKNSEFVVLLLVTPCSRRESRRHHVQRTRYISSAHHPRARPDRPAAPRQVAPSCSDDTAEHQSDSSQTMQGVAIRCGTGTSNPALSSGESIANPTFSIRTNPVSGFAVDCRLALALEGSRGRVQHWRRCRGPPSDGVAGAGRGGRDPGCRGGDSHGAGDGYLQPEGVAPSYEDP